MNKALPYSADPHSPPSNYLVGAILATVFCCQPFGIVSIIYGAQVNSKWQAGDAEGAIKASNNARIWMWVAIASALVFFFVALSVGIIAAIFANVFG